jgi:DNA (cytosine-5)-methyltransferase 1
MNYLDLFSGIGGFRLGLEQAGFKFKNSFHSEIDKYANQIYEKHFKSKSLGDVKNIKVRTTIKVSGRPNLQQSGVMPNDTEPVGKQVGWERINKIGKPQTVIHSDTGDFVFNGRINLITFGFPCQDLSIAGKRKGLDGKRSGLFFEAIRIIKECTPNIFIFENVKGLLSSNESKDFEVVLRAISDLRLYECEWQLLNTKWFLPQNRERIYFIGHLRGFSGQKIFPVTESDVRNSKACETSKGNEDGIRSRHTNKGADSDISKDRGDGERHASGCQRIGTVCKGQGGRVYNTDGNAVTLTGTGGGMGAKTGLYQVGELQVTAKKRVHETPKDINEYLKKNKGKYAIYQIAKALKLPLTQIEHYFRIDSSRAIPTPKVWLQLKQLLKFDDTYDRQVTEIYEKEVEYESSRRVYSSDGIAKTIDSKETGLYTVQGGTQDHAVKMEDCSPALTEAMGKGGGHVPILIPKEKPKPLKWGRTEKGKKVRRENIKKHKRDYNPFHDGCRELSESDDNHTGSITTSDIPSVVYPTLTTELAHSTGRDFMRSGGQKMAEAGQIRRLTPTECERLQGFPDGWTEDVSDTQRYKTLGNAVSCPVSKIIGQKLLEK